MPNYRVVKIPLDNVIANPQLLFQRGRKVASVGVLSMPAGTSDTADVYFGAQSDPVPLLASLQSINLNPALDDDIFYAVRTAAAGKTITLLIGYAGGSLSLAANDDPEYAILQIRDLLMEFYERLVKPRTE